nr:hypothetical protein [uncultured Marinifilum sp.]
MNSFDFNRQRATHLYRKWYVSSKKDSNSMYDKEQVDDLHAYLSTELSPLIEHYLSQKLSVYRAELPILFIGTKKIETFPVEILVLSNTIECMNMPGCMAVGKEPRDAFSKILYAIIECADARYRNGKGFMNIVHTMKMYDANNTDIKRTEFITQLKERGWDKEYDGAYNTVLFNDTNKVTYTVPKTEMISESMRFSFNKLQFQISAKMAREQDTYYPDDDY